jgi:hypothetical protein
MHSGDSEDVRNHVLGELCVAVLSVRALISHRQRQMTYGMMPPALSEYVATAQIPPSSAQTCLVMVLGGNVTASLAMSICSLRLLLCATMAPRQSAID